jgi:hypothetical protein
MLPNTPACAALTLMAALLAADCASAATPPTVHAAGGKAFQEFRAPDNSASASLPTGWTVDLARVGAILAHGPKGERLILGTVFIVRDGPYSLEPPSAGSLIAFSMPSESALAQKLLATVRVIAGADQSKPQVAITNETPFSAPSWFGQCGHFNGVLHNASGQESDFEATFCSLPLTSSGYYRTLLVGASTPAMSDARERATVKTAMASYAVPLSTARFMLSSQVPAAGMTPETFAFLIGEGYRQPNPGVDENHCDTYEVFWRPIFKNTNCQYKGPE